MITSSLVSPVSSRVVRPVKSLSLANRLSDIDEKPSDVAKTTCLPKIITRPDFWPTFTLTENFGGVLSAMLYFFLYIAIALSGPASVGAVGVAGFGGGGGATCVAVF